MLNLETRDELKDELKRIDYTIREGDSVFNKIPKCLLEAELILQIGQIQYFLDKVAEVDATAREEVNQALKHLYKAKKILKLDQVN